MSIARRILFDGALIGMITVALFAGCAGASGQKPVGGRKSLPLRESAEIAIDAYVYGYPLVMMDQARRVMTNVREPEGMRAPTGQFARMRTYPTASNHEVAAPTTDVLYTMAWLDVSKEPWVLSIPDAHDRYYLFSLLDGWTTVFQAPGKRTTGTTPQKYAITGPGWKGKLPSGLKQYKSPTSIVWVLGRIYCTGTREDYAAAHAMQDACSAVPLSSYGKPYTPEPGKVDPTLDMMTPVREQVNKLDTATFFNRLALLMQDNPPARADGKILKRMAKLGIVPGKPFDINQLNPSLAQILENLPGVAQDKIKGWLKEGAKVGDITSENGWVYTLKTGTYGTDYLQRALVAAISRGANLPQDVVVAISNQDGAGQPYSGNFRYVMSFPPGQAPSANGFWSLTMYDENYFLVENPLGRYTLSARDQLKFNDDGSLDLYLQRHPPGAGRESNWLPAPEEKFILMLRFYWPKESLLKGTWKIPPVKRGD
jgi:hypothetical protein